MNLHIGDIVLCEDFDQPGKTFYGREVAPIEKHEVRQCRTTKLVVIESPTGRRRVTDGEEVVCNSKVTLSSATVCGLA